MHRAGFGCRASVRADGSGHRRLTTYLHAHPDTHRRRRTLSGPPPAMSDATGPLVVAVVAVVVVIAVAGCELCKRTETKPVKINIKRKSNEYEMMRTSSTESFGHAHIPRTTYSYFQEQRSGLVELGGLPHCVVVLVASVCSTAPPVDQSAEIGRGQPARVPDSPGMRLSSSRLSWRSPPCWPKH